jgi:hypothetical protein
MSRLEDFAAEVHAQLNLITVGEPIEPKVGRKELAAQGPVRRIVWARSQTACTLRYADRRTGGQKFGKEDVDAKVTRENQKLDRQEMAIAWIRDESEEALDVLFDEFATALSRVPGTTLGLGHAPDGPKGLPYQWEVAGDAISDRGALITIEIGYRVPVATETKELVIVRAVVTGETIITGDE